MDVEGWTPEHDDTHSNGHMALAAATYAIAGSGDGRHIGDELTPSITQRLWPWAWSWFKSGDRIKELRAGIRRIIALAEADGNWTVVTAGKALLESVAPLAANPQEPK